MLLSGAKTFLKSLNPWQMLLLGLAIFTAIQHFELVHQRHVSAAYAKQRDAYKAQLEAITTANNEQKVVTREKIKVVVQKQTIADSQAKKVEQAPPAPNCRTKPEILSADL
jgi:hypothetical protein